jgi:dTDP-4-dehydrorhamnose 3,5-epimerase-like enzyme
MKKLYFNVNQEDDCNCGKLIAIEAHKDIPFSIERIFYIYDVAKDIARGAHAHKDSNQLLICLHGECEIILDNGTVREHFLLDSPDIGLLQPKLVWGEMHHFSSDAVLLVLSDSLYDPDDYIHAYDHFLQMVRA